MKKPSVLMFSPSTQFQKPPPRLNSWPSRPASSTVPISRATVMLRPVIVML
jgi:hypothetical protein